MQKTPMDNKERPLSRDDLVQISGRIRDPIYLSEPFEVLKCIKGKTDEFGDTRKELYVRAKNPSLEEWLDRYAYDEYIGEEDYLAEYGGKEYSYCKIGYLKSRYGDTFLFINHDPLAAAYQGNKEPDHFTDEKKVKAILERIERAAQEQARLIRQGRYKEETLDKLPAEMRTGKIRRADIWRGYRGLPDDAPFDEFYDELARPGDKETFLALADKGETEECPERIGKMTTGLFFSALKKAYDRSGHSTDSMTPREAYEHYADGRDEGLTKLPEDDPGAFEEWLAKRNKSGHPWEILRGGNSTHVSVYPAKDDKGYCLLADGSSDARLAETIAIYLSFKEQGLPAIIQDGKLIAQKLRGEDWIGIVPNGVFPRYCGCYFPGEEIRTFANFSEDDENSCNVTKKIIWQEEETPELAEASK